MENSADGDAKARYHRDLQRIGGEDIARPGANGAQGGNGPGLAVQIPAHRSTDPDAADGQCRQPGQGQEGPQPGDEALHPRRGVPAVAPAPAAVREARGEGVLQGIEVRRPR
jgi:hypothetical protein